MHLSLSVSPKDSGLFQFASVCFAATPLQCVFTLSFGPIHVLCLFSAARHAHPSCRSRKNRWTVRKCWHLSQRKCGIKLSKECLGGYMKLKVLGAAIHLSFLYKFPCVLTQLWLRQESAYISPPGVNHHRVIEMPLPPVTKKKSPSCNQVFWLTKTQEQLSPICRLVLMPDD